MKNYTPDTYLLSSEFQPIAQWWDSVVFVDKEDSSVVLKLYDPLDIKEVQRYYEIQGELAQKWGCIQDDDIELRIVDPALSERFLITENEDGVLVVLPRVPWINLWSYWCDTQRALIVSRVKEMLKSKWLPISGGFEVKPENIMVSENEWGDRLVLNITDVGARVDECLRDFSNVNMWDMA